MSRVQQRKIPMQGFDPVDSAARQLHPQTGHAGLSVSQPPRDPNQLFHITEQQTAGVRQGAGDLAAGIMPTAAFNSGMLPTLSAAAPNPGSMREQLQLQQPGNGNRILENAAQRDMTRQAVTQPGKPAQLQASVKPDEAAAAMLEQQLMATSPGRPGPIDENLRQLQKSGQRLGAIREAG